MRIALTTCLSLSILLAGCGSFRERQERAQHILDTATGAITEGVNRAKELGNDVANTLSTTTQKIQETASGVLGGAKRVEEGVQKIRGVVNDTHETIDEVKGGIDSMGNALTPGEE